MIRTDNVLEDSFGRIHDYLRISLTDNCNLRCFYCMPDETYDFTPTSKLMSASEIESLAKIFVNTGVKKIRLTGGEPLVRNDAATIIRALAKLPVELSLTTNGTQIHRFIEVFQEVGIRSVNVSLDSLQPDRFAFITRRSQFNQIWNNIQLLIHKGITVKINAVIMRGINDVEIHDFVEWTRFVPVHVRFIEYMPFTGNKWTSDQVITLNEILEVISSRYDFNPLARGDHDTSKKYRVNDHMGTFAVISTMSAHFCGDCNRLRLTADGKMKNCLFSKSETDLLTALRQNGNVLQLIKENVIAKHRQLGGQLNEDFLQINTSEINNRSMITIGG